MAPSITLLLILLRGATHTLAEMYPDPAPDCAHKHDEVDCREARSGGWHL